LHSVYNHFYMTVCCLDAFGAGALLAWFTISKPTLLPKVENISLYIAITGILLIAFGLLFPHLNLVPLRVKNVCIAFYVVVFLYQNQHNKCFGFAFIFNNPVMIYIVKISYGIYLFHLSIPLIWNYVPNSITNHISHFLMHEGIWILNLILLLLLASASYYFIEKPFLNLKKYYN